MATYTAVHLQTQEESAVHAALADWLRSAHGAEPTTRATLGLPEDFYHSSQFTPSESPPTRFVVMRDQAEWLTVFFNSFDELDALTQLLRAQHF